MAKSPVRTSPGHGPIERLLLPWLPLVLENSTLNPTSLLPGPASLLPSLPHCCLAPQSYLMLSGPASVLPSIQGPQCYNSRKDFCFALSLIQLCLRYVRYGHFTGCGSRGNMSVGFR